MKKLIQKTRSDQQKDVYTVDVTSTFMHFWYMKESQCLPRLH